VRGWRFRGLTDSACADVLADDIRADVLANDVRADVLALNHGLHLDGRRHCAVLDQWHGPARRDGRQRQPVLQVLQPKARALPSAVMIKPSQEQVCETDSTPSSVAQETVPGFPGGSDSTVGNFFSRSNAQRRNALR
jgi:hypothetical protein